jgi:hypothetical protein
VSIVPLPDLSAEEQDRANEEANAYALPYATFEGQPDVGDQSEVASGGRRLPLEFQKVVDRDVAVVEQVRLNKIGLARLNERRAKEGLPPLVAGRDVNVAPIGKDLVSTPASEIEERGRPMLGGAETAQDSSMMDVPQLGGNGGGQVDNSTLKYFPPIRDQGRVDSCVAWSEIYYATTYAVAMAYDWDAKNGGDDYRFSPMFTYNFLNEGRDQYTYFTTHFDIARYHGIVRWSEMPDTGDFRKWVTDEDAYLDALRTKTNGYTTIWNMSTSGLDTLKSALDNGHVAAFATFFRGWVFDTVDNDPDTTADDPYVGMQIAHNLNNTSGGHAMTIVGYNDDIWLDLNNDNVVDPDEKGAFIAANSDGTGWKNGGYTYITYDVVRQYSTITGHDGDGLIWQNRVRIAQAKPQQHEPSLVARITLNHNKRNQVKVQLGTSTTSSTTPSLMTTKIITDTPYEGTLQGGAYAFSGAAAAYEDFTYYLDFSDNVPAEGTERRFYVQGTDIGSNDGNLTIQSFELFYRVGENYVQVGSAANAPIVANGSTEKVWVDWTVGDVKPVLSLEATDSDAAEEGQDPGVWTITRVGDLTDPLTVFFSVDGTASIGSDYTLDTTGSITIPADQASVTVTLTPVDDSVFSEFESADMTLTVDDAYVIETADPVAITITDNDNHTPVVDAGEDQTATLDGGAAWTPASVPGLTGWYDASDGGTITETDGAVSQWRDKSVNALHLSSTSGREPTTGTNTINGINALDFTNDEMSTASNPFSSAPFNGTISDAFVIVVHKIDDDGNKGTMFTLTGTDTNSNRWQCHAPYSGTAYFDTGNISGGGRVQKDYGTNTNDNVLVGFYGSTTDNVQMMYKNGSLLVGDDDDGHSATTVGNIFVGSGAGGAYQDTTIGEMVIIAGTISTEDRQNLEGYLAHKWNLAGNLPADHPYKAAAPGGAGASVALNGTVTDDDGGAPNTVWTRVSGPDAVHFADETAVDTTATFGETGVYVLRLTANDGFGDVFDEVTITVSEGAGGDADSDGIDDTWETFYFPGQEAVIDGTHDSDGDGVLDFFEYLYGSVPTDAASRGFRFAVGPDGTGNMVFDWKVEPGFILGQDYGVMISTDLSDWDPLPVEHYDLFETSVEGKSLMELELTHDYGSKVFLKLVQPQP